MADMEALRQIAAHQHGLVTRGQAADVGLDHRAVRRRVATGVLTFVTPRVLRIGGAARSPWEGAMVGVLDVGHDAVASHLTAAALWGTPNVALEPVDVSVERFVRMNQAGVRVHHLTTIPKDQRASIHNVPVTAPPLTVLLVTGRDGPRRGTQVLDHFLAAGLMDVAEGWELTARLGKQGRNGLQDMREILEARSDGQPPPESNNERRFLYLAGLAGFTDLERQVDISAPAWIGRVDFLCRALRLVIEILSERYHSSWANRQADAERFRRLEAAGYTVVTVWDRELWAEGDLVVTRLTETRHRLLMAAAGGP